MSWIPPGAIYEGGGRKNQPNIKFMLGTSLLRFLLSIHPRTACGNSTWRSEGKRVNLWKNPGYKPGFIYADPWIHYLKITENLFSSVQIKNAHKFRGRKRFSLGVIPAIALASSLSYFLSHFPFAPWAAVVKNNGKNIFPPPPFFFFKWARNISLGILQSSFKGSSFPGLRPKPRRGGQIPSRVPSADRVYFFHEIGHF